VRFFVFDENNLLVSEQNTPAEIIPINKLKYHGGIMEKIKKYRTLELTRIAHPEQFFSRCQVHTSGDSPPLCLIFVHHGSFDDPVAQNFVKVDTFCLIKLKQIILVDCPACKGDEIRSSRQYHVWK